MSIGLFSMSKLLNLYSQFAPYSIEPITWPRRDTGVDKYFTSERNEQSEIFFQHEKRNFVSPSGNVMFFLLYKHQRNTKPFYFNSFLV